MKNIQKTIENIMDIFVGSPGIKGMLGYVVFIAFWLILFPDNPDFAVELADHLPYLFVYAFGMLFMELLSINSIARILYKILNPIFALIMRVINYTQTRREESK